ncbi:MAG: cytochrome P460 family protein, partial [Candidatus Poribacteria bacterium]|nr:cytochrome P460 family protein [Candidatus Poribacteria bacterium]
DQFEEWLYKFLREMQYKNLEGWVRDKQVRDTGPYINGTYYGSHPAARIFYSPEVYHWLKGNREDQIPDGATIIKEMYDPPAARYDGKTEAELQAVLSEWTVMIKDSAGAKDGWFWSYYAKGQKIDTNAYPFNYPNSGFGQYCVRCHASAEKEFTFSSLRNIQGEPGEPVIYRVDDSWMTEKSAQVAPYDHVAQGAGADAAKVAKSKPVIEANAEFLKTFNAIPRVSYRDVEPIPPLTYDHVVAGLHAPTQFVTSDQCLSCHGGLSDASPFGPAMFLPPAGGQKGVNLSPYGEWNWSMMGLAGRDPIFYAQLESELNLHPTHTDEIQNTCFTCHGVMGKRQLAIDHPGETFEQDIVYTTTPGDPNHKYGALARDGISCSVCHQIVNDEGPLEQIFTGEFEVSGPDEKGISSIYGPFDKPATLAMESSLGMKPVKSDYIKSSRLCASCHVVFLPIYNSAGEKVGEDFEQATYLEWLNSTYDNELRAHTTDSKTCQGCHMPGEYHGRKLAFRIATIQDQTYPEAEHLAPIADITVPIREEFRRHTLSGINIFALEMFNQFDNILGVRKTDYMTGSDSGLLSAIAESNRLATEETARVEILKVEHNDEQLSAEVKVTNLTGHRFPSGVSFRRAFLEFKVIDAQNTVVWASGRTNSLGIIVDGDGNQLPSEFFEDQSYQPHHQRITRQDAVQIYEELVKSPEDEFTTSFLSLKCKVKDNRLLPKGWTRKGPPGFKEAWAHATKPAGKAWDDAQFLDGTGIDTITYVVNLPRHVIEGGTVVASLYYQSIPPAYLKDRFTSANGKSTRRLHYLTSHLTLAGTPIDNWKLLIDSKSQRISP